MCSARVDGSESERLVLCAHNGTRVLLCADEVFSFWLCGKMSTRHNKFALEEDHGSTRRVLESQSLLTATNVQGGKTGTDSSKEGKHFDRLIKV